MQTSRICLSGLLLVLVITSQIGHTLCEDATPKVAVAGDGWWDRFSNVAKSASDHAARQAADLSERGKQTFSEVQRRAGEAWTEINVTGIAKTVADRAMQKGTEFREGTAKAWADAGATRERVKNNVREALADPGAALANATERAKAKVGWAEGKKLLEEVFSSTDEVSQESEANTCAAADSECLVEKQIDAIIELRPVARDFYVKSARKIGKSSGSACILGGLVGALLGSAAGPLGAATGAAQLCAGGGFLMGLLAAIDVPSSHWAQSLQAAYRARKAYSVSFAWLDIDAFDIIGADPDKMHDIVGRHFRKCAVRYHPDKLPTEASVTHRDNAATKFANCKFAKAYILSFQKRYGILDPEDTGTAAQEFLRKFAGAWAASLGTNDGIGSLDATQVAEWMASVKHHVEL